MPYSISKSKYPLVTMIVSNLNGMNLNILKDCLESLLQTDYPNWELLVVDGASSDSSVLFMDRKFKDLPNCRVIKNPVRIYSQGLNLGASCAKGEYLAYFNNDVGLPNGYFQELIKQFKRNPRLGIAQGKLLSYFDHSKIDSAGETMDLYGNPITIGAGEKDMGQYDNEAEILSASGSACMIKKSVFEKIGGYDPTYCIGYEDMDLSLRARRMGYTVKRFPKATIYHKRASTDLAKFIRVHNKWHFNKNRLATMIKNYPIHLLIQTLPITLLLYLGITIWEWLVNQNWAMGWVRLSSIIWGFIHLPSLIKKRYAISELSNKELSTKEIRLFSPKSLQDLFKDFKLSK